MKTSTILWLAGGAVVAYFIYTKVAGGKSLASSAANAAGGLFGSGDPLSNSFDSLDPSNL